MSVNPPTRSFVGQLVRSRGETLVRNPFQPDEPLVRASLAEAARPEGSFVEVRWLVSADPPSGPRWQAQLLATPGTALADVLEQVGERADADVDHSLRIFITVLEPALIVAVAGVVFFVVLAALLPVFSLNTLIK